MKMSAEDDKKRDVKHWTDSEKRYLGESWGNVPIDDICRELGRSRQSVDCQAVRMRLSFNKTIENNLLMVALISRFVRPEWFSPDRQFFRLTRINQKRWWKLYRGEDRITDEELVRLFEALNVDHSRFFELRQKQILFKKQRENDE